MWIDVVESNWKHSSHPQLRSTCNHSDNCILQESNPGHSDERHMFKPPKGNSMVVMTFFEEKKLSEAIGNNSELKY